MKKKIPAKVETKHAVAVRLAAEFHVKSESVYQWFETGCPQDFDGGKAWKLQRLEEAKIRAHKLTTPCKYERARGEAANANKEPLWELMSPDFRNLCDIVCDLYLAGLTLGKISARLGTSEEVVCRIVSQHPRTKDKDKEFSSNGWADIRRLAQSEIRERLQDPIERKKIKAGDLNFLAGTAHDKLEKSEAPPAMDMSIRSKIEAMTYADLIESIKRKQDAIDAEFVIEGDTMSEGGDSAEIKSPSQSQQAALLGPKKDGADVSGS